MPITPPNTDVNARAANATAVKYGASEAQLNRAIDAAKMQEIAQKAALDQYGAAGRQAIGQTYTDLYSNLAANKADTVNQLGTQVDQVGRGYRDANQLVQTARDASQQRLSDLAGRIGRGGDSVAAGLSPIEDLVNQIVGQNAQSDATRSGNLRTWAAQQEAFMNQGIDQAHRSESERKSSFENELLQSLADLQAKATDTQVGLQGGLLDLLNEKGSFQQSALDQYINELFGQQMQAAQYNLSEQEAQSQAAARAAANDLAARELGLKERSYNDSKQGQSLQDMLALAQNDRAERSSALENALRQKQLGQVDQPSTLDEWAAQNGVGNDAIAQLLKDYNSITNESAIAQALAENKQLKTDDPRAALIGADPMAVLMQRLSGGMVLPGGDDFVHKNNDGTYGEKYSLPDKVLMTPAQVRAALSYLGGRK